MDREVQDLYLKEMILQLRFAFDALERWNEGRHTENRFTRMSYLDDFIDHVSRALMIVYPDEKARRNIKPIGQERARILRERIGIPLDEATAAKYRKLRSDLQHFDERLDEFIYNKSPSKVLDSRIIARSELPADNETRYFRLCIIDEMKYRFLDNEYDLQIMSNECADLLDRCERETNPNWKGLEPPRRYQ